MSGETQKEADSQASSVPHPVPLPVPVAPPSDGQCVASPDATTIPKASSPVHDGITYPYILLAAVIVLVSGVLVAVHFQSFLEDAKFRGVLVSAGMHKQLRGMVARSSVDATGSVDVPLMPILGFSVAAAFGAWLAGAAVLALISWSSWRVLLWRWGVHFIWLWALGLFEAIWDVAGTFASGWLEVWFVSLSAILPMVHAFAWGGWIAGAIGLMVSSHPSDRLHRALAHPWWVWASAATFAGIFSTLSILQYRVLLVPHGDSAMYEEHLWNLLHGKGFRSQLDSGRLFFGEHLEIIHMLLLPIYIFLPSLATLNICLSLGLASGAIAVRGITRRLTGSDGAANWLAVAYLLYFPLQYLNLEVSLKAFRPENFGVPLLLFAIWALEAKRFRTMLILLALTLLCKEDYSIPVGMLGLFLMTRRDAQSSRRTRWLGLGIFAFSAVFLAFVLTVFIPTFRDAPPHYMAYYPELGNTPWEIATNVSRNPRILIDPLIARGNVAFIISLVAPLALLPLVGISRIWLCLPTLVSILLIQLSDARSPFFHFHAPLVPILFWAAADGLNRLESLIDWRSHGGPNGLASATDRRHDSRPHLAGLARLAAGCALASGFFFGKSPLSLAFYDPDAGLRGFWQVLYCPNGMVTLHFRQLQQLVPVMTDQDAEQLLRIGRVRSFDRMFPLIPQDASVAATDYVRPRFTHHRECHQYGEGGLKPHVNPDQIDYIVIDLMGPYSDWLGGQRLREMIESPDRWEVMHWDPDGELFFHVLRAKR